MKHKGMAMLTDRLHRAIDRAAELPEAAQDAIAEVLEQLLNRCDGEPPKLGPDLSAIVEQAMCELADTVEYLKDK